MIYKSSRKKREEAFGASKQKQSSVFTDSAFSHATPMHDPFNGVYRID